MDWSETEVRRFISEEINYYGFEVTPEQSKQGISPWKRWLWLEKNGFDFAHVSLEAEIFQFRLYDSPPGVPLASERRLLVAVREVMRRILSLPPLDVIERERLLAIVPISNRTHWASVRRPYGNDRAPAEDADFSDMIAFAWDLLERESPDYLRLLHTIRDHEEMRAERFTDNETINGTYDLLMWPRHQRIYYSMVVHHYVTRAYDMFAGLGNLRVHDFFVEKFLESVEAHLGG